MNGQPIWLIEAMQHLGLREIPGAPTEPTIASWLKQLGAWWRDDETPWCGTAVAAWMKACGIAIPKHWYRAKGWLDWGSPIDGPTAGAVVVFERQGGGHVGIIVGEDRLGRLMVIGGNQGNRVSIAAFNKSRVLGYRWPSAHFASHVAGNLPFLASDSKASSNEA